MPHVGHLLRSGKLQRTSSTTRVVRRRLTGKTDDAPWGWLFFITLLALGTFASLTAMRLTRPPAAANRFEAYATLFRRGAVLAGDQPLAALSDLRPGDSLRLRFVRTEAREVLVEGAPDGGTYHQIARSGIRPGAVMQTRVRVGPRPPVHLRISLCDDVDRPETCQRRVYAL